MDSISCGGTVAFAIECFEKGILTLKDTDGLDLSWGNAESIIKLVENMIERKGLGDILADGSKKAAERIGRGSEVYAVHCGGQEAAAHDSKHDPLMGLVYSIDATPARHTTGGFGSYNMTQLWQSVSWAPEVDMYPIEEDYAASNENALKGVALTCYKQLLDSCGGCTFGMMFGLQHWSLFEMLNMATGWSKTPEEYMNMGKRLQTMRQMFNIRQGVDPWSYRLHPRLAGEPPLTEGANAGRTVLIDDLMKLYWKNIGWDEQNGVPKEETIRELGLQDMLEVKA